ncbi:MAG TPA: ATPase [Bacteroidales bacterium]|nr:ATPase [Bacteroidales bacterium]
MERKIETKLQQWMKSKNRQPLIVQGARQVGKTYSISAFGRKHFSNMLYLNFESNNELSRVFDRDLSPVRIIKELSVLTGEPVVQGKTLLFFDEIQSCSRALTSLKYFCEEASGYHVIAAGSLLGVYINRDNSSYPVGKVDAIRMYPLDFEEYLWAVRGKDAAEMIRASFNEFTQCSLHEMFNDFYRTFIYTGGMPQVVKEHSETGDTPMLDVLKKSINSAYIADMARYADKNETVRIMAAYGSLPAQLAKENHKFQYKTIRSGARSADYGTAIEWLKAAGVVTACQRISEGRFPVSTFEDQTAFKLYHSDTGLLTAMTGITAKEYLARASDRFRGAITENSVAVALSSSDYDLYYWESQGRAEVDFVIEKDGNVIPVEVKSGDNVRSKSLAEFIKRYSPPFSYRVSFKNFGNENNIRSIPLYSLFCL